MTDKYNIKPKICFVAPTPPPYGGIANWTKLVTGYMDKKNIADIQVVNTAPQRRITEGRGLFQRIFQGGFDMLVILSKVKKEIKNFRPNCIYLTTSGSLSVIRDYMIAKMLANKNVKFIYHIHFGRIPEICNNNTLEWKIIKKVIRLSSYTIAIDIHTQNILMTLFGDKIIYIPNPINIRSLPEPADKVEDIVIYLGWVIKQKGIEELIASWESIKECKRDWKLQIVGPYKKEYIDELKRKYNFEGVELLGEKPHEEAMKLLNKASIFVLPSYSEGCPYVVIEAMALKKIIIGTAVGNIPGMLSDNSGILVKPKDIDELKEKLQEAIINRDKLEIMGISAYEKVVKDYEISIVCEKMIDLINNIVKKTKN